MTKMEKGIQGGRGDEGRRIRNAEMAQEERGQLM